MRWYSYIFIILFVFLIAIGGIYLMEGKMKNELINLDSLKLKGSNSNLISDYPMTLNSDIQVIDSGWVITSNDKDSLNPIMSAIKDSGALQISRDIKTKSGQIGQTGTRQQKIEQARQSVLSSFKEDAVKGDIEEKDNSKFTYDDSPHIEYDFDWGQTNFYLYREDGSQDNIDLNDYQQDDGSFKVQAVDNSLEDGQLQNYTYVINSTDKLIRVDNQVSHREFYLVAYNQSMFNKTTNEFYNITLYRNQTKTIKEYQYPIFYNYHHSDTAFVNETQHKYNFKDICSKSYANCKYNISEDKLSGTITFTSDKNIDPLIDPILTCGTIDTSGYYHLLLDLTSPDNCIIIDADSVVLNGNGHTIDFDTDEGGTSHGVLITNHHVDITIENFGRGEPYVYPYCDNSNPIDNNAVLCNDDGGTWISATGGGINDNGNQDGFEFDTPTIYADSNIDNLYVLNNTLHGTGQYSTIGGDCINLRGYSSGSLIRNNTCFSGTGDLFSVNNYFGGGDVSYNEISGNKANVGYDGVGFYQNSLPLNSNNNLITRNIINSSNYGVFNALYEYSASDEVSYNNITSVSDGIFFNGMETSYGNFNNNNITSSYGNGINLDISHYGHFRNNNINSYASAIVFFTLSDAEDIQNNNLFNYAYYNIYVVGSNYLRIINNNITSLGGGGIESNLGNYPTIMNNNIYVDSGAGLVISANHDSYIFNNTIKTNGAVTFVSHQGNNNIIYENNMFLDTENYACFYFDNSNNNNVTSNVIKVLSGSAPAIYLQSTSQNNYFSSNNVTSLNNNGFSMDSGSNNEVIILNNITASKNGIYFLYAFTNNTFCPVNNYVHGVGYYNVSIAGTEYIVNCNANCYSKIGNVLYIPSGCVYPLKAGDKIQI